MKNEARWGERVATLLIAAFFAAACAPDSAVTGLNSKIPSGVDRGFVVGGPTQFGVAHTVEPELLEVCKEFVNAPVGTTATFGGTAVTVGAVNTNETSPTFTLGDDGCVEVFVSELGSVSTVTINETGTAGATTTTFRVTTIQGGVITVGSFQTGTSATVEVAGATGAPTRGALIEFVNTFVVPEICTFTKGWYRNNGADDVIAVDGRTKAQAQAILAATPGQPGSVNFGGDNTLLNLYQQFLTALINLGGDANEDLGPTAVDDAIDAVQAGTGGTGLTITTTLTQAQMSALINTLSAFNEGQFAGFPHCPDE